MGCSEKKFRTERSPTLTILLFSCLPPRMPFSPAALLRTLALRLSWGLLDHLPPLGGVVGIGRARAHDARKPARLREGIEHQDQKDRKGCRQKRPRSPEQPRPEDKPQEEDRRGEAEPPAHQHL